MAQIDLTEIATPKSKVLAGHQRGLAARQKYQLDRLEGSGEQVRILAPSELETITPSFVQGFLGESASHLDRKELISLFDLSRLAPFLRDDLEIGVARLYLRRRS